MNCRAKRCCLTFFSLILFSLGSQTQFIVIGWFTDTHGHTHTQSETKAFKFMSVQSITLKKTHKIHMWTERALSTWSQTIFVFRFLSLSLFSLRMHSALHLFVTKWDRAIERWDEYSSSSNERIICELNFFHCSWFYCTQPPSNFNTKTR